MTQGMRMILSEPLEVNIIKLFVGNQQEEIQKAMLRQMIIKHFHVNRQGEELGTICGEFS